MSSLESTPSTSSGGNTEEPEDTSDSGEPPRKRKSGSSAAQVMQFLKQYGEQEEIREKERLELAQKMHSETRVSLI
jgi:hypothetical protein